MKKGLWLVANSEAILTLKVPVILATDDILNIFQRESNTMYY